MVRIGGGDADPKSVPRGNFPRGTRYGSKVNHLIYFAPDAQIGKWNISDKYK